MTEEILDLTFLKKSLGITDDKYNSKLTEIVIDANEEIETALRPYVTDIPLVPKSRNWRRARTVANYHARAAWFEHIFQTDKAEYNDKKHEEKLEVLLMALKAEKPDRTKTVFIPARDPLDVLHQPANTDEYILREFGSA